MPRHDPQAAVHGLGRLESAIMVAAWSEARPVSVRTVRERMAYSPPVAHTTVATVMGILHHKGLLLREKCRGVWVYWPATQREDYDAGVMAQVLRSGGDTQATMRRLLDLVGRDMREALRKALLS